MALDNNLMDWNDEISQDGEEFILLPEGDYEFVVTNFERGRFPGGQKIPACNKATITFQIESKQGTTSIRTDLFLYRTVEWKIASFFRCIGQKKHGEKITMNWNKVVGSHGKCHVKQRSYTNKNGEDKLINEIDKFYDYEAPSMTEISDDDLPF